MEFLLHGKLIDSALEAAREKKNYSDDIINRLKLINSLNEGLVNYHLETSVENNAISVSSDPINLTLKSSGLSITFPGIVKQIEHLYDTNVILWHAEGLILANSAFTIKEQFPFSYTSPIVTSEYNPNAKISVINFAGESLIFVPCTNFIQVYNYKDNLLTYVNHIGVIPTNSNPSTTYGVINAIHTEFDENNQKVLVYISESAGLNSKLHKLEIEVSGEVNLTSLIFSNTVANGGLMAKGGITTPTVIKTDSNYIYMVSQVTKELGVFRKDNLANIAVIYNVIKELVNDDSVVIPESIDVSSNYIVGSDRKGHVFLLSKADFDTLENYTGSPKETTYNTTYPNQFGLVSDVHVINSTIFFISDGKLYSTNLLTYVPADIMHSVTSPSLPAFIKNVYNFNPDNLEVRVGSSAKWVKYSSIIGQYITPFSSIEIKEKFQIDRDYKKLLVMQI